MFVAGGKHRPADRGTLQNRREHPASKLATLVTVEVVLRKLNRLSDIICSAGTLRWGPSHEGYVRVDWRHEKVQLAALAESTT